MQENFLTKIIQQKKLRLEPLKKNAPLSEEEVLRQISPQRLALRSFHRALEQSHRLNIIAEIKRASPSKGVLRASLDPIEIGLDFESHGAAAISVLTEEDHFQGSLADLKQVSNSVTLPTLRKDFIFDPYQIFEAALNGASAILLIVAALEPSHFQELQETALRLGLSVLVEVHDAQELETALSAGSKIIGINNRDLRTFRVDLQTSLRLGPLVPDSCLLVSESGITTPDDIFLLQDAGFDAFLIGELFMRSLHPGKTLRELIIRRLNLSN
jgi:indole-3-glycerol phosphate synthase